MAMPIERLEELQAVVQNRGIALFFMGNGMKKSISAAVFAAGMLVSVGASAHGALPQHNGVVSTASDLHFELVNRSGTPVIYVEDHGRKLPTAGATGKLTLLNGTEKSDVALQSAGDNILQAREKVPLKTGTKVIASITFPDKKAVNVRFAAK